METCQQATSSFDIDSVFVVTNSPSHTFKLLSSGMFLVTNYPNRAWIPLRLWFRGVYDFRHRTRLARDLLLVAVLHLKNAASPLPLFLPMRIDQLLAVDSRVG